MVSNNLAMSGGHKHCAIGDMFLVVEKEDFRCYHFNPPLLFISKEHDLKAHCISYL